MSSITFRLSDEYGDIAAIHDALYAYNLSKTGSPRVEVCAERFPGQQAILACGEDGKVHGGIAFHRLDDPGELFVDYFFLDDAIRGRGEGRRIFEFFFDHAKRAGAKGIELTTNTFQAPGFYLKMGFRVTEEKASPVPLRPDNIHYSLRKEL